MKDSSGKKNLIGIFDSGVGGLSVLREIHRVLKAGGLPVYEIEELKQLAENYTGAPKPSRPFGRTVAEVEYRDFSIIDRIGCVER